jgi:hypothetical protein
MQQYFWFKTYSVRAFSVTLSVWIIAHVFSNCTPLCCRICSPKLAGHVLNYRDYHVPVKTDSSIMSAQNFGNEAVSRSTLSHSHFIYEIHVNRFHCSSFHKLSQFITFKAEDSYNYHNYGLYSSSCLLFKTHLSSRGLSVSQRKNITCGVWRWHIRITTTILDIIHRPVFYLNLNPTL